MAGYFNAGQDCTAATRVICAPGAYDDFVAALAEQRPVVLALVEARAAAGRKDVAIVRVEQLYPLRVAELTAARYSAGLSQKRLAAAAV